jgi:hypothetical protein
MILHTYSLSVSQERSDDSISIKSRRTTELLVLLSNGRRGYIRATIPRVSFRVAVLTLGLLLALSAAGILFTSHDGRVDPSASTAVGERQASWIPRAAGPESRVNVHGSRFTSTITWPTRGHVDGFQIGDGAKDERGLGVSLATGLRTLVVLSSLAALAGAVVFSRRFGDPPVTRWH